MLKSALALTLAAATVLPATAVTADAQSRRGNAETIQELPARDWPSWMGANWS